MPKKSIYLPDHIMPIIAADETRGFSQRLAGIVEDWHRIITQAMPEFSQPEWLYLMDMLNGTVLEGRHAEHLASDVLESEIDGLGEKWEVSPRELATKVDALPLAGKLAIHDVAYRFWQRHGIVNNWREILVDRCGAKIAN